MKDISHNFPIYRFIKEYIPRIPVLTFQRGEYLFRAEDSRKSIYYILSGTVEVENVTYSGKKIIAEQVQKNTFTGFIADMHHVKLRFSGVAKTAGKALVFSESLMKEMMKNADFSIFFYQETSCRLFKTYKMVLLRMLFGCDEILAYNILDNTRCRMFAYENACSLCENMGMSKRSFYNILYRFEDMGYIKKRATSLYEITDEESLENLASHVESFMRN